MAEDKDDVPHSPDVHFEPVVNLPKVDLITLEENEQELIKLRAKLFRYANESDPAEWKERGVGDVKILKHKCQGTCRVLMRRDKTHKVCLNHYITPAMTLRPNCGSDRAWVWSTLADFADEEPKPEMLAIRFTNHENATKYKETFETAQKIMAEKLEEIIKDGKDEEKDADKDEDKTTNDVVDKLKDMSVSDKKIEGGDKEESKENSPSTPPPESEKPASQT